MNRVREDEPLTFWEALNIEEERRRKALPFQERVFSYLDRGLYAEQSRRLLTYFPRDQILFLKSKTLRNQPQSVMDRIFEYLGLTPIPVQVQKEIHSGDYQNPMTLQERDFLLEFYRPEIHALEKLLGWDCSEWLE